MPQICAFRGWRYNLERVGRLGDVVAPPYDVIGPELQEALYEKHPCNVVRLILNRRNDTDTDGDDSYTRSADDLNRWQQEQVLVRDAGPALYVCRQTFQIDGQPRIRGGLMAAVRIEDLGQGHIYAHERTLAAPKQDRLRLTRATGMNLSPVFGLYPDLKGHVLGALRAGLAKPAMSAEDADGVRSDLWPVTLPARIAKAEQRLANTPVFIADGHHRYETACAYRRELADAGQLTDPNHPANFVLMMLVAMSDPGLAIQPTHRLVGGLGPVTHDGLRGALGDGFACDVVGEGIDVAHLAWTTLQQRGQSTALALYTAADRTWMIARLKDPALMEQTVPDHSPAWRLLGVSLLHSLVLDRLVMPRFGREAEPELAYVHLLDDVEKQLATDRYQMGALVLPATMDDVQKIAAGMETLPPKTTYFAPKILSGLVMHDLSGEGP